jgi:hypothetical protein
MQTITMQRVYSKNFVNRKTKKKVLRKVKLEVLPKKISMGTKLNQKGLKSRKC